MSKKRLFVDLDGTLATWNEVAYFEMLLEEGYFRNLAPYGIVVNAVREIELARHDIEVYINSAYLTESDYALPEKKAWVDRYIHEIPHERRIFTPSGTKKSDAVRRFTGTFTHDDYLLDDYSVNLHSWVADGGQGIKLLNGINGTNGSWKGPTVSRMAPNGHLLAMDILSHIN